jgi:glucose/arabinose dehydrogenase
MRAVVTAVVVVVVVLVSAAPAGAVTLGLEPVGRFREPVYVTSPPGDAGTLAVVLRHGTVRIVRHGKVARRPLVDVRVRIADPRPADDQRGLLSIAFPPDYATSRRLYLDYVDRRGVLRVDEFKNGRLRRVLDLGWATTKHHGGQLQFGPDGLLYVSTGMADDPSSSQDPRSLRGKILRLDPRRRPVRPEVVALGLRNPWRFSFDRRTGALLIGEVGEHAFEEVDVVPRDATLPVNFGWPSYEGRKLVPGWPAIAALPPALVHRHGPWCAVMGGYVAHGHAPASLEGRYVYGDVCAGRVWSARFTGARLVGDAPVEAPRIHYLDSFGEDARGRLYAVSFGGGVWRLVER